ncbi:MAG: DUF3486 family protein [Zoogloea oleivorans]|jgi:hypothetical protein|uniref:phage protein Gp27 family protein n=1 Tax=Zoogloea oleivorans TaxID=1552750 RepID=UPI002A362515|nr:phage protein Gp27 family protein [Zoogloea oleivorans]MDY0035438.1 DUF3486 family protein [Zoogloea oleivorans]
MGRRSSIDQGSPGVRKHILMRLRENRLTLAELRADLEALFPAEKIPSKSALGRHRASIEEMISHEREMAVAAEAMVAELGEGFDAKSGALLAQAVTTLASRTAMNRLSSGADMDIADVLDLARAAKAAQEARSLNLKERNEVARLAREKLLAEQDEKLKTTAKAQGMTEDQVDFWRRKVLGIGA